MDGIIVLKETIMKIKYIFLFFLIFYVPLTNFVMANDERNIIFAIDNSGNNTRFDLLRTKIEHLSRYIWKEHNNNLKSVKVIPIGSKKPEVTKFISYSHMHSDLRNILDYKDKVTFLYQAVDLAIKEAHKNDIIIVISDFLADHDETEPCKNYCKNDYQDLLNTFRLTSKIRQGIRLFPIYLGNNRKINFKNNNEFEKALKICIQNPRTKSSDCTYNLNLAYYLAFSMAEKLEGDYTLKTINKNKIGKIESTFYDILLTAGFSCRFLPKPQEIKILVNFDFDVPENFINKIYKQVNSKDGYSRKRYIRHCRKNVQYFFNSIPYNEKPSEDYMYICDIKAFPGSDYRCMATVTRNKDNHKYDRYPLFSNDSSGLVKKYFHFIDTVLEEQYLNKDFKCRDQILSLELKYKNNKSKSYSPAPGYRLKIISDNNSATFESETTDRDGRTNINSYRSEQFSIVLCNTAIGGADEIDYKINIKKNVNKKNEVKASNFWSQYDQNNNYVIKLPVNVLTVNLPNLSRGYTYKIYKKCEEYRETVYYKGQVSRNIQAALPPGIFYLEISPFHETHYLTLCEQINMKKNMNKRINIKLASNFSDDKPYRLYKDYFFEAYNYRNQNKEMINKNEEMINKNEEIIKKNEEMIKEIVNILFLNKNNYKINNIKEYLLTLFRQDISLGVSAKIRPQWTFSPYPFHLLSWLMIDSITPVVIEENLINAYRYLIIYQEIGLNHPTKLCNLFNEKKRNLQFERDVINFSRLLWKCILLNIIFKKNFNKAFNDLQLKNDSFYKALDNLHLLCRDIQERKNYGLDLVEVEMYYYYARNKTFNFNMKKFMRKEEQKNIRLKLMKDYGIFK